MTSEQSKSILEITTIIKEAEGLFKRYSGLSDFCIWHSRTLGRLRVALANQPQALEAWSSLQAHFVLDWDDDAYMHGSTIDEYYASNPDEKSERDWFEKYDYRNRVLEARRILLECISVVASGYFGDVHPAMVPQRVNLDFIEEKSLRALCNERYRQSLQCIATDCYDACAFLLGSVLEGILFSVLKQREEEVVESVSGKLNMQNNEVVWPVEKWGLNKLIDEAFSLGWLKDDSRRVLNIVKEHRNYIHPAKRLIDSPQFDRARAKLYVNAIELCVKDINDALGPIDSNISSA